MKNPSKFQHQGFGLLLMEKAEEIAKCEHFSTKISVISGMYLQKSSSLLCQLFITVHFRNRYKKLLPKIRVLSWWTLHVKKIAVRIFLFDCDALRSVSWTQLEFFCLFVNSSIKCIAHKKFVKCRYLTFGGIWWSFPSNEEATRELGPLLYRISQACCPLGLAWPWYGKQYDRRGCKVEK